MIYAVLGLVRSSHTQRKRLFAFGAGVISMLVMTSTSALAQDHVYTAGDKIRQWDLNGTPQLVWNFPGIDVAVDPPLAKIFWATNINNYTGKIMRANLNGTGGTTYLMTGPIDQLQIDVGNQMIYWDDVVNDRIYRSSTTSPSAQLVLNTTMTIRAFALDLRPSKLHLYYLVDPGDVYRADLNGSNSTKLLNNIGSLFNGIAIDTCTDHIIATGVTNAVNPNFPLIIRADLSDAGNQTTILQDPTYPYVNVGLSPSKVMLDLNGGTMYWVVSGDFPGISTVRRANLNGTVVQPPSTSTAGPTVIAQGSAQGNVAFAGIALQLANTTCTTVGVNKDMQNNTGHAANNIEILLAGSYVNVNHYDGYPANLFSSFTESPAPGGNTLLTWSNPNNDVQPGQIAHVGFVVSGSTVNILSVSWTHNSTTIGCVSQVSANTHLAGSAGSQVIYANNCLGCKSVPRYVGALTVEWYAHKVPLAELNPRTHRKPIRTDVIRRAPILLAPKATVSVNVPEAPPNALFGVVVHKVSTNPRLSGPDVTTDFLEFAVTRIRSRGGPATQPHRIN